jgi:hypothetical protein
MGMRQAAVSDSYMSVRLCCLHPIAVRSSCAIWVGEVSVLLPSDGIRIMGSDGPRIISPQSSPNAGIPKLETHNRFANPAPCPMTRSVWRGVEGRGKSNVESCNSAFDFARKNRCMEHLFPHECWAAVGTPHRLAAAPALLPKGRRGKPRRLAKLKRQERRRRGICLLPLGVRRTGRDPWLAPGRVPAGG